MNKLSLTRGLLSMAAAMPESYELTRLPDMPIPTMWRAMPSPSRNTVSQKKRRKMARRKG